MIDTIDVTTLKQQLDSGHGQVIDVREGWEFAQGHVPGASWIPMNQVPDNPDAFRADQPVFVICRSGNRSGQVVTWLAQRGIATINVSGGTADWDAHGYPLATETEKS